VDVVVSPALQEDICLVQQQDSVPCLANLQNFLQFVLESLHFCAQFAHIYRLEGFLEGLCRGFSGKGLTYSGRAVQQKDDSSTLAADDVVVNIALILDDKIQIVFAGLVHDKFVEGVFHECNGLQFFTLDLTPLFAIKAESLEARLAVLEELITPFMDVFAVLLAGLVTVDLTECVVVNHHSTSGTLLEGNLPFPSKLHDVAGILDLRNFGGILVEESPTGSVRVQDFSGRLLDGQVFYKFEVLEFGDLEGLSEPQELFASILNALGLHTEVFFLLGFDILGVLHTRHDAAALVGREHTVARQEVLFQVIVRENLGLPNFFGFLQLVLEFVGE